MELHIVHVVGLNPFPVPLSPGWFHCRNGVASAGAADVLEIGYDQWAFIQQWTTLESRTGTEHRQVACLGTLIKAADVLHGSHREQRENQRMSLRDLEVLSSIDPIKTTSTGDSECVRV